MDLKTINEKACDYNKHILLIIPLLKIGSTCFSGTYPMIISEEIECLLCTLNVGAHEYKISGWAFFNA